MLVLCVVLLGCDRVPPSAPGTVPPCYVWAADSSLAITVEGLPGATVTVKRCVVGGRR